MQSHCQHNLYICHCSPSSQDPSPIHPLTTTHQTTTLHRFPAKRQNGNVNTLRSSQNGHNQQQQQPLPPENGFGGSVSSGELVKHKYTVSHSSVAVMTSPTLNIEKINNHNNQESAFVKVPVPHLNNRSADHEMASVSPSTASSCSSIPTTTVMTMQQCNNGNGNNGSLTRYSQHLGKKRRCVLSIQFADIF